MKNKLVFLAACAVTVLMPATVKAQYPGITKEAGEISGKIMSEGRQRSDEAWAKALPIVEKEAKEGRPYIPWASRPDDLPQAKIPAFPGAEGGGMFSYGGRGGMRLFGSSCSSTSGPLSHQSAFATRTVEFLRILVSTFSPIYLLKVSLSSGRRVGLILATSTSQRVIPGYFF